MEGYNALHHALLYSYIMEAAFEELGEAGGEEFAKRATVEYGRGRGRRMRMRCDIDGYRADALGYAVYGEWRQPGNMPKGKKDFLADPPYSTAESCPWYDAWKAEGQLDYGKYYCMYVDESIGEGFYGIGADLKFVTVGTRTNGAAECRFEHHGRTFTAAELEEQKKQAAKVDTKALMSWEYHIGHCYYALERALRELQPEKADVILNKALDRLERRFGKDFTEMVLKNKGRDFDTVDYRGC